jgi:hypothetical protein
VHCILAYREIFSLLFQLHLEAEPVDPFEDTAGVQQECAPDADPKEYLGIVGLGTWASKTRARSIHGCAATMAYSLFSIEVVINSSHKILSFAYLQTLRSVDVFEANADNFGVLVLQLIAGNNKRQIAALEEDAAQRGEQRLATIVEPTLWTGALRIKSACCFDYEFYGSISLKPRCTWLQYMQEAQGDPWLISNMLRAIASLYMDIITAGMVPPDCMLHSMVIYRKDSIRLLDIGDPRDGNRRHCQIPA